MHEFFLRFLDYTNTVILIYFLAANSVYTVLMFISLYTVSLHAKYAAHKGYTAVLDSPVTPPVALIVPAHNEERVIVQTVLSLLALNYPEKEIIVVDDGSSDSTLDRLIEQFELQRMDLIYREQVKATAPLAFFSSSERPELIVVSKPNGGKADALNVGMNLARSPYFCTVDADSIIERDALLRLMTPVVQSAVNTVVSGGIVRIVNGCRLEHGEVVQIDLPKRWLERCQVVEYIRTFMFGRPGWNSMGATFITSGAFCLLHRETAVLVGGFRRESVTEDIDLVANLHRFLRDKGWKYNIVFSTDPICWTEAPHSVSMLARQRRRWQLGLMQTVMRDNDMIFNPRFGSLGMFSMPFHAYIEAIGSVVEAAGTILIPFSFFIGAMPLALFLLFVFLAVGYGTLLSVGSALLHETTLRRYPKLKHVLLLVLYAVIENVGYKQMVTFFRAQGVLRYFFGRRKWEYVVHTGKGATGRVAVAHET